MQRRVTVGGPDQHLELRETASGLFGRGADHTGRPHPLAVEAHVLGEALRQHQARDATVGCKLSYSPRVLGKVAGGETLFEEQQK